MYMFTCNERGVYAYATIYIHVIQVEKTLETIGVVLKKPMVCYIYFPKVLIQSTEFPWSKSPTDVFYTGLSKL